MKKKKKDDEMKKIDEEKKANDKKNDETKYPKKEKEVVLEDFGEALALDSGTILFRGLLPPQLQQEIMKECLSNRDENQPVQKQVSSVKPVILFYSNWNGDGKKNLSSSSSLIDISNDIWKKASSLLPRTSSKINTDEKCVSYEADGLSCLLYGKGSNLPQHRDSRPGWVMGISIGSSATFFFSEKSSQQRTEIQLESGDVIVYHGTRLLHGIASIVPDSYPSFWKEELKSGGLGDIDVQRLVLQFRDTRHVPK